MINSAGFATLLRNVSLSDRREYNRQRSASIDWGVQHDEWSTAKGLEFFSGIVIYLAGRGPDALLGQSLRLIDIHLDLACVTLDDHEPRDALRHRLDREEFPFDTHLLCDLCQGAVVDRPRQLTGCMLIPVSRIGSLLLHLEDVALRNVTAHASTQVRPNLDVDHQILLTHPFVWIAPDDAPVFGRGRDVLLDIWTSSAAPGP